MAGKAILAGGSGFLGQALAGRLAAEGWEIVVLSRDPRRDAVHREVIWDGRDGGYWTGEVDGADAVVNLAGRSINCVHNDENRRAILDSRLDAVCALGAACAQAKRPPGVWIQASATGYYGDAGEVSCSEVHPPGNDFLADVCQRWEESFARQALPQTRCVVLRLGPVLDASEGPLPPLARLTRCFLGGAAGAVRQYFSWIHRDDLVAGFHFALTSANVGGTYNLCSPVPVTNDELMRELRAVLHRPWAPRAPEPLVRFAAKNLLRTDPVLALHGQRANPQKIQQAGLKFQHPLLDEALKDLLGEKG